MTAGLWTSRAIFYGTLHVLLGVIFDTEKLAAPPGPALVELIDVRISEMAARYGPAYPSAMKALTTDRDGLTAYLRFPAEHHNRVRHSNFIERTFGETRRRT